MSRNTSATVVLLFLFVFLIVIVVLILHKIAKQHEKESRAKQKNELLSGQYKCPCQKLKDSKVERFHLSECEHEMQSVVVQDPCYSYSYNDVWINERVNQQFGVNSKVLRHAPYLNLTKYFEDWIVRIISSAELVALEDSRKLLPFDMLKALIKYVTEHDEDLSDEIIARLFAVSQYRNQCQMMRGAVVIKDFCNTIFAMLRNGQWNLLRWLLRQRSSQKLVDYFEKDDCQFNFVLLAALYWSVPTEQMAVEFLDLFARLGASVEDLTDLMRVAVTGGHQGFESIVDGIVKEMQSGSFEISSSPHGLLVKQCQHYDLHLRAAYLIASSRIDSELSNESDVRKAIFSLRHRHLKHYLNADLVEYLRNQYELDGAVTQLLVDCNLFSNPIDDCVILMDFICICYNRKNRLQLIDAVESRLIGIYQQLKGKHRYLFQCLTNLSSLTVEKLGAD